MTIQEKISSVLLSHGFVELKHYRTKKYRVFQHANGEDTLTFLGKAGAVRRGKTITSSIDAPYFKAKALADWEKNR